MLRSLLLPLAYLGTAQAFDTLGQVQSSGLIPVREDGSDIFYWHFAAQEAAETAPLVFWLHGGPACSSEIAVFIEHGPYRMDKDQKLSLNEFSWSKKANMVYVDSPVGTGLSSAASKKSYDTSEEQVAEDFHAFVKGFLAKHPEFKGRDTYIAGSNFAGHFIPFVAKDLQDSKDLGLNLQGISIGGGWVDPYYQYPAYGDWAAANMLISTSERDNLYPNFVECQAKIERGDAEADRYCSFLEGNIFEVQSAEFNVYNVKASCPPHTFPPRICQDTSAIKAFLNSADVRKQLNVTSDKQWEECDTNAHAAIFKDHATSVADHIPKLLESGIKVQVYTGEHDYQSNWYGQVGWVTALEWSGRDEFLSGQYEDFRDKDYNEYGDILQARNLSLIKMSDVGQQVAADSPKNALFLFEHLLAKQKPPTVEE